ncbi:MAG: hypothetical protein M3384_17775 [Acidobacteriota bacterium]|nr:hypothetical protein [Acidobacteriota bacterium]
MQSPNQNAVLILSSVTGGERKIYGVPSDKINRLFVPENRAMFGTVNANREHFEMGVKDLAPAEAMYPGWLGRMLAHPFKGSENYARVFDILSNAGAYKAIKTYFEVGEI